MDELSRKEDFGGKLAIIDREENDYLVDFFDFGRIPCVFDLKIL